MILLSLLAVLGYGLALARSARWSTEAALFSVICLMMTFLFWAGFFGVLLAAAWVLLGGGLIALASALVPTTFQRPLSACVTPGLLAFVALSVIHWLKLDNAYVWSWDEFSHWALQGKVISLTHALPAKDDPVVFKDYPPGAALLQYVSNLGLGFSERNAIAAQGTITLAAIVTVLQGFRWRQSFGAFAVLMIAYGLVYLLGQGFNTLLIDQPIGAVFGATLVAYFLSRAATPNRLFVAVPGLLALPLMKAVGLQLAFLVAAIISLDVILGWTASWRTQGNALVGPRRLQRAAVLSLAALFIAPLVSKAGWDNYTRRIEAAESFRIRPSIDQVLRSLSPSSASERDRATIGAFEHAFGNQSATIVDELPLVQVLLDEFPHLQTLELTKTNPPQLSALTSMHWLVLFVMLSVPLSLAQAADGSARRFVALQTCLAVGFAFYAFGHLIAYLYAFSEHEGTQVASFARYMRSYLLGWALVLLALSALACREGRCRRAMLIGITVCAFLSFGFLPARAVQFFEGTTSGMIPKRAALQPQLGRIKTLVDPKRSVYIVFQNTNGFEYWIAKYELAPIRTNVDCWSVGLHYGKEDAWTCDLSPEQFYSKLREYDYVYLGRTDQVFWQRFANLFPHGSASHDAFLFAVRTSADGAGELVPVAP